MIALASLEPDQSQPGVGVIGGLGERFPEQDLGAGVLAEEVVRLGEIQAGTDETGVLADRPLQEFGAFLVILLLETNRSQQGEGHGLARGIVQSQPRLGLGGSEIPLLHQLHRPLEVVSRARRRTGRGSQKNQRAEPGSG